MFVCYSEVTFSVRSQVHGIATPKSFGINAKCVVLHLDCIVWYVRSYD